MKESKIYNNGHILKYIPFVNLIIMVRFELLFNRGYFDRLNIFLKGLAIIAIIVAFIIPIVLVSSYFDPTDFVKVIINFALFYIISFVFSDFALREEKKVRDSGFFWTPDSK